MPPTTTPVPIPTPAQTVELQIPQDVIDRLRQPDPGFWSQLGQPLATVFGALFVLIAAVIAYKSAMKSIDSADTRAVGDRDAVTKAAELAATRADERAREDRQVSAEAAREAAESADARAHADREAAREAQLTLLRSQADTRKEETEAADLAVRRKRQFAAIASALTNLTRVTHEGIRVSLLRRPGEDLASKDERFLDAYVGWWDSLQTIRLLDLPGQDEYRSAGAEAGKLADGEGTQTKLDDAVVAATLALKAAYDTV